jgi:HupE / UreJ protein
MRQGCLSTAWLRRLASVTALLCGTSVQAHLMVAQRGTLNIVGDGAYMVMSLPVSAFKGVDDDGDGLLSLAEGNVHIRELEAQVRSGVRLISSQVSLPLEGLMITLSPPDNAPSAPAAHLVVVGRYALGPAADGLSMKLSLFGTSSTEQTQEVTVTRGAEKQRLVLASGREQREILPPTWDVFVDHARLGAEHVLGGMDHLLFLLVVLATGWRLRQTVLALTCFTAGHAITLAASAWGGWGAPSSVVEPAIAATIVGMVLFDRWSLSRPRPLPASVRLALVFACALVHGLGLAGGLTELGLDREHLLLSLGGFNAGIEAAQLAVAVLAAGLTAGVLRLKGPSGLALTTRLTSFSAFTAGSVWLVQRVAFQA